MIDLQLQSGNTHTKGDQTMFPGMMVAPVDSSLFDHVDMGCRFAIPPLLNESVYHQKYTDGY